jgi:predicted TIM-barrel fold metal-dependent hydrolase
MAPDGSMMTRRCGGAPWRPRALLVAGAIGLLAAASAVAVFAAQLPGAAVSPPAGAGGSLRASQQAPIIDMHLHALSASANGPPPQTICAPFREFPAHDPRRPWLETFAGMAEDPPCDNPLVSPPTDDELMRRTLEVLERRNIIAVTSGSAARVARWRRQAPDRIIPGLGFRLGEGAPSPEDLRAMHEAGDLAVLAEVTNQYVGIEPDDERFEPYLAMAEEIDLPIGIHIGTGPPGAPYLPGNERYRARMHSPLSLEEPLLRHPRLRVYVMHAGWPMLDDTLALMWTHPQVYVGVGVISYALPRAEFHRYLRRLVEAGFGKRIMFGSDQMVWPDAIEVAIESIESADFLSEQQKRDILYNNAARFLRLPETERHP